jgi:CDP-diacylglycerol--glycerol-3-phosphate 3-phosphatidyltransferase
LAAGILLAVEQAAWSVALALFVLGAITDWLDGFLARRWKLTSAFGRAIDPLTDKVLVCSAFIALIPAPQVGVAPWMVALIVARELLVTGLRGLVEARGVAFGADLFGKLKTVFQMTTLLAAFTLLAVPVDPVWLTAYRISLWLCLIATVGSGAQYAWKAARLLRPAELPPLERRGE